MEVGIGIHGEPGRRREPLGTAHQIAAMMVQAVIYDLAPADGAELLVFTNSMGGTPLLELYVLHGEIERELRERGLRARPPARRAVHHVAGDGRRVADACSRSTTSSPRCGMLPSTPPRSAGGRER